MPRASVIIPAYNASGYIAETIHSILNQSFEDYELIIVDDGSTDSTADIIRGFTDNRIQYIRQSNSGKPAAPRNKAIRQAKGDLVFIFDSDDVMLPGKLATTIGCLDRSPTAGLAFTGFACIDEQSDVINPNFLAPYDTLHSLPKTPVGDRAHLIESRVALRALASSNYLGTSGVAMRRQVFERVGYFDEQVRNSDDFLMWQAVASQYDLLYIPEVFHNYRVRSGSISLRKIEERAPGLIACTEKMKQYHQGDPKALKLLNQRIQRYYFEAGYSYFSQYRLKEARLNFLKTLRKGIDKRTLFYLTLSFLPVSALRQMRRLKQISGT
jgi:glycosyltransferase involved in cell wall biosynthesis